MPKNCMKNNDLKNELKLRGEECITEILIGGVTNEPVMDAGDWERLLYVLVYVEK